MSRNPVSIRFDSGAPPPHGRAVMEVDGGEEATLARIDPGSRYQRSGLEEPAALQRT